MNTTSELNISLPVNTTVNHEYSTNVFNLWTDLDWRKVQAIFELDSFNPSHKWIAHRLNLKVERVTEIIEGLLSLGIISRTEEGYKLQKSIINLQEESVYQNSTREQKIDVYSLLSKQVVNEVSPDTYAGSEICVTASNKDLVLDLYNEIHEAFKKFVEKSSASTRKDKVYSFTFSGANNLKGDL